jgi:hypothetical protein
VGESKDAIKIVSMCLEHSKSPINAQFYIANEGSSIFINFVIVFLIVSFNGILGKSSKKNVVIRQNKNHKICYKMPRYQQRSINALWYLTLKTYTYTILKVYFDMLFQNIYIILHTKFFFALKSY